MALVCSFSHFEVFLFDVEKFCSYVFVNSSNYTWFIMWRIYVWIFLSVFINRHQFQYVGYDQSHNNNSSMEPTNRRNFIQVKTEIKPPCRSCCPYDMGELWRLLSAMDAFIMIIATFNVVSLFCFHDFSR